MTDVMWHLIDLNRDHLWLIAAIVVALAVRNLLTELSLERYDASRQKLSVPGHAFVFTSVIVEVFIVCAVLSLITEGVTNWPQ